MRPKLRSLLAAATLFPMLVMLATPSLAQAEEVAPEPASPLAESIVEAIEGGASTPEEVAAAVSLPVEGGGSLTFDDQQRLVATVMFAGAPDAELLAEVAELAAVTRVLNPFPGATVSIAAEQIAAVEGLDGVLSVIPALRPMTGTAQGPNSLQAAPRPAAPTPGVCGGIPNEADAPLRADIARSLFNVDGTGVTIGIISDSFNVLSQPEAATSWADDVASGALPGAGNPCGRALDVEVLGPPSAGGSDEGRAMAQLVHGIAPGAKLLFAGAGNTQFEMVERVQILAAAGADIIVDDISWPTEPYFQQGYLSGAVEKAKAQYGLAYFTSAGNSNGNAFRGENIGSPLASWQTTQYRPTACPDWVNAPAGADCLDFDPDPATSVAYDTLQMGQTDEPGIAELKLVGSIGEPVFGVTTSYQVGFYQVDRADPESPVMQELATLNPLGGPLPGLYGQVFPELGAELRMVMVRTAFDENRTPPAVYLGFIRGADMIASRQFMGNALLGAGATDRVGPTVLSHAGDGSAVGVASLDWENPTEVRDYSGIGPNTMIYAPVLLEEAAPAAQLPAPVTVESPKVAAVDGTQTTFFGDEDGEPGSPEYRFGGTSAAAPLAAAVAALGLSYAPNLTGAELTNLVVSTARGTADGGPVNPYPSSSDAQVFGTGIVDAMRLLEAIPVAPSGPDAPAGFAVGAVTPTSLTVNWSEVGTPERYTLQLFAGDLDAQPVVTEVSLPAGTTSHTFTGLAPNRAYSLRITPYGADDIAGTASTTSGTTAAATPKPEPVPVPADTAGADGGGAKGLSSTGSQDSSIWFIAGGAVLILGAGLIVLGRMSAKRRRAAEAADGSAAGAAAQSEAELPADIG